MRLVVLTVLLLAAGCGTAEHPCTLIGTRVGIAFDATPGTASVLTVCWNGSCRDYPVDPSGFAEIPDLPVSPVEVTAAGHTVQVTPRLLYPNGPGCGAGGPQAGVVLDQTGLRPR